MPIHDLYSKRQKRLRGEVPDVFTYDELPQPLKVQIVHIWRDAIGESTFDPSYDIELYKAANHALCREYGVFHLNEKSSGAPEAELSRFFLNSTDIEDNLDVI